MEYFDVLNENGEFTGKVETRTDKTGPWNFLKKYYETRDF